MPVLSGIFHWNLLAGQCLSQPSFKPEGRIHKCIKGIQFNLLLSPYPCFISLLYLDLYVLGDDALIS